MKQGFAASLLAAGAAAGGLCLLRSEYERDCLVTEAYTLYSRKLKGAGKTFVFLSDLHDKEFGRDNERLLAEIRRAAPDAVLVGGDMMVTKKKADLSVSLKLLRALSEEYPVYCCNGNHEDRLRQETHRYGVLYREYRKALDEMGVVYLSDQKARFGEDFVFYGLDLPRLFYESNRAVMKPDFLKRTLGENEAGRFSVLLNHSPMFFPQCAAWGADLTLSGHFHGGTIRLPFLGGVMTPQYQFFCPWCAGLSEREEGGEKRYLLVSRGLGTHSINIRLNNKPQVIVVRVERETTF